MSAHRTQFITEALLARWIEQSEHARAEGAAPAAPVTRLCHPLRDMLAINGSDQIVGLGGRLSSGRDGRDGRGAGHHNSI